MKWAAAQVTLAFCIAALLLLVALPAKAGNQQYEPLEASVRTALAAAIQNVDLPEPRFKDSKEKVDWLTKMSLRLMKRKPDYRQRIDFLKIVHYEASRAGLDPHMVLGLIEVESGFKKYAVSYAGARGYMQVMPFWTKLIGDGDPTKLFDMRVNIRYGCTILRHYLDRENGNLFMALGRYNGSRGKSEYPNLVLGAWRKWEDKPTPGVSIPLKPQYGELHQ
ncbi:lytic transglycosylase domain-containing protein [Parvibium lacunae]|uniref:Lytic transglycosylase domain-containing protein n=1 Tax=Parvibium lacunae TaxID=1888893 RepID=A0A368L2C0_9BURK|nr:lytic transglycosylase domain-containing protein [Parvibium lacunae]RCS57601.1 lytic transglycosylase domain-containing protein [Parvibium lacunae]